MRTRGDKVDVSLNGEACCGKNSFALKRLIARKAGSFDEPQPLLDAARSHAVAIMIEDALAPRESESGIFAARENGGIFNRNAALVVVTIQSPGLQLAAGKFSFVHKRMKRMFVVVALFADSVKPRDEICFREQRQRRVDGLDLAHIASSIPS